MNHFTVYMCLHIISKLLQYLQLFRVRLQCRSESRKVMSKGAFEQAVVVRGRDWIWKNQDGQFSFISD